MNSILFGLLSALAWGGGDFTGGVSSRKLGMYRAVFLAEVAGLILLVIVLLLFPEPIPATQSLLTAAAAGLIGTIGLMALYQAMTKGKMSIAAPVSALLAAALPVLVGMLTHGLPRLSQLAGMLLAGLAIWLVSISGQGKTAKVESLQDLLLALAAGACFGLYFILLHMAAQDATLWIVFASRSGGTIFITIVVLLRRESWSLPSGAWPLVTSNGFLDVGGSVLYALSTRGERMDIPAVLSSLYPGITALLAWFFLKEKISRAQQLGILISLIAIVFMTI